MSSQPLIVNELLAFITHAIDYMDELSVLQICKSQYKEEEVSSAKLLLFQSLGKVDQMPSRRRDGTAKSVQDIITLLKEVDPDDVPNFVAKELHKLPPVTFDHVDVTRLLKDITSLKTSLTEVQTRLEISENTVGELRAEVVMLRSAISTSRSPDDSNVDARQAVQNTTVGSFEAVNASPNVDFAGKATCTAVAVPASTEVASSVSTSTPQRAYAAVVATSKLVGSKNKRRNDMGGKQTRPSDPLPVSASARSLETSSTKPVPEKALNRADDDGFVTVQKRKRRQRTNKNRCGTAPTEPNVTIRAAKPNTPVYISRLHYTTKAEDIVEYVRLRIKYTPRVQLLESRRNVNFKAFVVRVPTCLLHLVMEEDFWPQGVVFRRFRGQVPHDRAMT